MPNASLCTQAQCSSTSGYASCGSRFKPDANSRERVAVRFSRQLRAYNTMHTTHARERGVPQPLATRTHSTKPLNRFVDKDRFAATDPAGREGVKGRVFLESASLSASGPRHSTHPARASRKRGTRHGLFFYRGRRAAECGSGSRPEPRQEGPDAPVRRSTATVRHTQSLPSS